MYKWIDRKGACKGQGHGVPIGRRFSAKGRADTTLRTGFIFYDDRLSQLITELGRHHPSKGISAPARRIWHNNPERFGGKGCWLRNRVAAYPENQRQKCDKVSHGLSP